MMRACTACGENLPDGATQCHACLVAIPDEQDVYDLSTDTTTIPPEWEPGAVYTLELRLRSPHCKQLVRQPARAAVETHAGQLHIAAAARGTRHRLHGMSLHRLR